VAEQKPDELAGPASAEASKEGASVKTQSAVPSLVDLPRGEVLDPETAGQVTRSALTRLIVLAGDAGSGKTTLLSAIYEKFNEGPFAGFLFGGSVTLPAWEQRCHLARIGSGAERPATERTKGLQKRLLHLRVRDSSLKHPAQDLLLSDLSGETFRLIRDSQAECERLSMLRRADHFVLLLDGEKLARTDTRHEVFHNGALLLRACRDAGMIGTHSFVDVLFSKDDKLRAGDQELRSYLEYIRSAIRERHESQLGRLRFQHIASRPETDEVEFAFGIAGPFASWVNDTPLLCTDLKYRIRLSPEASEFERFLKWQLPALVER